MPQRTLNLADYKIMIVDDVSGNIDVLTAILREETIKTESALSGKEAIKIVETVKPDLILLDILMPEMDGFEVCKQLKANPATAEIPIIFITALTEKKDMLKGLTCGAVDYIIKPFNAQELLARIYLHLELKNSRDEIKKQRDELNIKNQQLNELVKTREKFLSIISHDLKNPFNSIIGLASLLRQNNKKLTPEKITYFGSLICSAAQKGCKLLDNLLYWTRSKSNKINFCPSKICINELIKRVFELYEEQANQKNIKLIKELNENLIITGDENMLDLIIRNLVSNALKFTRDKGTIKVKVAEYVPSSKESSPQMIKIDVEDTGIGIRPEILEKLFRTEECITTPGIYKEKGTGLGLLLCKEFVEKHKGKIWVESELQKGSKFSFILPGN